MMRESYSPLPLDGNSSHGIMANAIIAKDIALRRKRGYGRRHNEASMVSKRSRERNQISNHSDGGFDSFPRGRDSSSFESSSRSGDSVSGCAIPSKFSAVQRQNASHTPSPSVTIRPRPLSNSSALNGSSSFGVASRSSPRCLASPSGPMRLKDSSITPAKSYSGNSFPRSVQTKELPSSSSLVYLPKRFQNHGNYGAFGDEENASPNENADHFYDAQQQHEDETKSLSPSLLSDFESDEEDTLYSSEVRKSDMCQTDGTPMSTCDSICALKSGTTGLCNLGNTCFMNAAIQCLAHTPALADFFLNNDFKLCLSENEKITSRFADVIAEIYKDNNRCSYYSEMGSPCSPDEFLEGFIEDDVAPQFAGSRQHDSHEFLRVLIDRLCEDLKDESQCQENRIREATEREIEDMSLPLKADYWWKRHLAQNSSFITDQFCGQLISTIQCTVCRTKRYCFDPFYDISLPFPEASPTVQKKNRLTMFGSAELSRCSLDDCVREFCKDEVLDGENMIECSKCREKRESIKRLQVFRFPRVLVLHLKRFGNSRKKVRTSVSDISSFDASGLAYASGSPRRYELYAACCHSGRLNFGHYTATCIDPHSSSWYKFNDARVSSADTSDSDETGAYMLFYRLQER